MDDLEIGVVVAGRPEPGIVLRRGGDALALQALGESGGVARDDVRRHAERALAEKAVRGRHVGHGRQIDVEPTL